MFPCLPWKREEKKWRSQAVHEETCFSYDYFMNNNASSSQRYVILRSYVMLLSLIPSGTRHQRLEPIAWSDVRDTNQIRGLAYRLSYHRHAWRGDGLFKEERGATKKGVGRNKTYVWKWQGGGEHLDSTEHIALLFIQQPFTIKLTYRYPNTNTRTHASRIFKPIIRLQPNEDSCLALQGDLALRFLKEKIIRLDQKSNPFYLSRHYLRNILPWLRTDFLMFNLIRVDHSLLEPNQQYVQNKVIRAANVQTSIWTTRRHLLHFCKVCLPFGNLIIYSDTRHNRTKYAKTFEPKVMAWGTTLEEHTTLNSSFTTVSCSRSLSIRFHSQPGHLSKGTLKTETRITLKSHQTHQTFFSKYGENKHWDRLKSLLVLQSLMISCIDMSRHTFQCSETELSSAQGFLWTVPTSTLLWAGLSPFLLICHLIAQVPVIMALYCAKYFSTFTPKTR